MANGRRPLSWPRISCCASESATASRWVRRASGPVVIAGDFNMPSDSDIFKGSGRRTPTRFPRPGLVSAIPRRLVGMGCGSIMSSPGQDGPASLLGRPGRGIRSSAVWRTSIGRASRAQSVQ